MTGVFSKLVTVGKGNETGAEAPDKLLLGGAVQFNRQDARMEIGQFAEQGLFQAVLVEQAEIGVVRNGNDVAAGFGHFLDGCHK